MVWHAVTAIVFCSVGVLIGGFMSALKVAYLYDALDRADLAYGKQSNHFDETMTLFRDVMKTLRHRADAIGDGAAIDRIVASLEQSTRRNHNSMRWDD